jgi:hypothetical protein
MDGTLLLAASAALFPILGNVDSWARHPALFAILLWAILTSVRALVLKPEVARALGWIGGRSKTLPSLRLAVARADIDVRG